MLPPFWQTVTLFNPVVYLISGFRWSFYEISDVNVMVSLGMTLVFLCACLGDHLVDLHHRLPAQGLAFLDLLSSRTARMRRSGTQEMSAAGTALI